MIWVWIVLAPVWGGLIYGFERVLRARMQRRIGPPILQPFYDMFKLMDKRTLIVHPLHALLAVGHFAVLWLCIAGIFLGWNLLYIVFLHLAAQILLVLAGYSVKSPYSHLGANRELLMILAYEPILILAAVGFYLHSGSFGISTILTGEGYLPKLLLLFAAVAFIVPVKVKKSPFDIGEAHQEIVGGVEIEYGGLFYELLYMSRFLEYIFIYSFVFLFGGADYLMGSVLVAAVFLAVNLVDNATARLRPSDMFKRIYTFAAVMAVVNLVWVVGA